MPMIEIKGLENDTPQLTLETLQEAAEFAMAHGLGFEERMCHVDLAVSPIKRKRDKVLIWGQITTGFFQNAPESDDFRQRAKSATRFIAEALWDVLDKKFTVEIFPPSYMDQGLKTLIKKA